MEKYFAEGTLSDEDLIPGLKAAVREGRLYPIFAASASQNIGVQPLLTEIVELAPRPTNSGRPRVTLRPTATRSSSGR